MTLPIEFSEDLLTADDLRLLRRVPEYLRSRRGHIAREWSARLTKILPDYFRDAENSPEAVVSVNEAFIEFILQRLEEGDLAGLYQGYFAMNRLLIERDIERSAPLMISLESLYASARISLQLVSAELAVSFPEGNAAYGKLFTQLMMLVGLAYTECRESHLREALERARHAEAALQEANSGLERRVAERTEALVRGNAVLQAEISERKHAEAELQQRTLELSWSNRELEEFAYAASHDLQEPLRAVIGYVQLVAKRQSGVLSDEATEFLNRAAAAVKRMQTLIRDLLAYSRVGKAVRPVAPVDVEQVLHEVREGLRVAINESSARITHSNLPTVLADESQLRQLLQNLVSNAIKFRKGDGVHVHIDAMPADQGWHFTVRDNGIGIEDPYRDRIFTIFQRLHPISAYEGTGVGLAICKKIVERHGGRIWAESEPGHGSTFHFTLP